MWLTGHRPQFFFFALFSLQTVSLLQPTNLFSQATHLPFLAVAPKTFIKSTENQGVNRFIFPEIRHVGGHCAFLTTANERRSDIRAQEYCQEMFPETNKNKQTLQFPAHQTFLFLMHAKTLATGLSAMSVHSLKDVFASIRGIHYLLGL